MPHEALSNEQLQLFAQLQEDLTRQGVPNADVLSPKEILALAQTGRLKISPQQEEALAAFEQRRRNLGGTAS